VSARRTSELLRPEDIETADLPRAMLGGYDRRRTDDLLRRIASGIRGLLHEQSLLEEQVQRLEDELARSERVILQREQADEILRTAEKETVARVEALKRVERVHGLVRVELRTMLGAMLEALNSPSDVVRESLKDPHLMEDLQSITRAAVEAGTTATPNVAAESGVDLDDAVQDLTAIGHARHA
jgi:hypothetical protein